MSVFTLIKKGKLVQKAPDYLRAPMFALLSVLKAKKNSVYDVVILLRALGEMELELEATEVKKIITQSTKMALDDVEELLPTPSIPPFESLQSSSETLPTQSKLKIETLGFSGLSHKMMGDTSPFRFPVAVQWDLGHERLKQVKNKLLLHFQSKKKSDGGECELRDMNCSQGHILIYFKEESVRDQVMQKQTHELQLPGREKLKLDVRLPDEGSQESNKVKSQEKELTVLKEKPSLSEPDSAIGEGTVDKTLNTSSTEILIGNIQDSCTPETLSKLLENVSNLIESQDFLVEMIPEICSAVVTFTQQIDISTIIKTFCSCSMVIQLKLTAKPLEETKSIRVENLPPNMLEQYVTLYFESPKHGGGSVQDTELLPDENAAVVTFCDRRVLKTVLEKQHVFGNTPISVYPYHPSLGVALYGKSGPCVTLLKPIEFEVSPYILEFILRDPQLKQNIERQMEERYCDLTWPVLDCPNPIIKLCVSSVKSTHLRTMAKIAQSWTDKISAEFLLVMSTYKTEEYNVDTLVWEAIKDEASNPVYGPILIKPDFAKKKVFLAGLAKDVTKVEQTFRNLVENATGQIERRNKSITMTEPLNPTLYKFMCNNGLEKNILKRSPNLKMEYDESLSSVMLYGLKEEVDSAKSEILNMKQQLKSKTIHLDSHINKFLEIGDNVKMSCLLLTHHNINAVFEIDSDNVTLTGFSMNDLSEAEELMKRELVCKHITIEDKKIIQSTEWKHLTSQLYEVYNSEKVTVLIDEFLPGNEIKVVITGLSVAAQDTYQQLYDFIEKNTEIQKDIQVKSLAVMQFLKEEQKQLCEEIQKNVKMEPKHKSFSLHGPRLYVQEAAALIKNVLSSLYCETLCIDKPGAQKFCLVNEFVYATTCKDNFNCLIYLQKDEKDDIENIIEPHYQITLPCGVIIAVYKDDLTSHCVDVVVNVANENLKHTGGLALDLLKAAGPKLQTDCDLIIKEEGKLSFGDSVITDAGNLPCKQVIHTVGPMWDTRSQARCDRLLKRAIMRSLELAAQNGHNSIGIPAVSSGIFRFPVDLCAQSIVESIWQFVETEQESRNIKVIHLVDTDDLMIKSFTKALKIKFGEQNVEGSPKRDIQITNKMKKPPAEVVTHIPNAQMVTTKEGIIIRVIQGNIQDATSDVIVNSVGKELCLDSGGASKVLSQKAGKDLQKLLDKESKGSRNAVEGSTYTTDGCDLSCQKVIHVVVPQWTRGNSSSEKKLQHILNKCLSITEENTLKSITFTAIGTGILGFPKRLTAALMFDEFLNFSNKNKVQYLQEINVMLQPSDHDTLKAFSSELEIRAEGSDARNSQNTTKNQESCSVTTGLVTSPTTGVYEMKIGTITYQVLTGDITNENTEVIVNSSNHRFDLQAGVSKAILEKAGKGVQDACAHLGSKPNNGRIITEGGNLPFKNIIHAYVVSKPENIKQCVTETLQECEKLEATSIALPVFGTGIGGASPAAVADAMLDGVMDFAKSKAAQLVQTVKVIIFQKQMLNDFYTSMKKKEGINQPEQTLHFSKITCNVALNEVKHVQDIHGDFFIETEKLEETSIFELKENIKPSIFHLCGKTKDNVVKASSWLQDLILKEQHENIVTDEWIKDFDKQEHQKLSDLQKSFQVLISYESPGSTIKVSGLTRDVLDVSQQIQYIIKNVRDKKTREREAELCSNLVEWTYLDGAKSIPFDRMTNLKLEKAKNENKLGVDIDIAGVQYTVNIEENEALDSKGNTIGIKRVPKHENSDLPTLWDKMDKDQVKTVLLNPGDPEYTDVQNKFAMSSLKIIKIERIQNRTLWLNYQIKKQSMDTKNGNTNNEKQLFHGTSPDTIKHVIQNGYNRSYAGKNAACYGNGTYFAVNASYSASDVYSKPDTNGYKYMYLAQVLTGISCTGSQGMLAPLPKSNDDQTDLYDSATNNIANPVMYVIFNDIQAYPEYLITFTK
ncbi:protein mono-ADP-ribosyltransferase PARP14-like [Discoglossus pictus]